ncbi:MAG: choice-of-anchor V domain-containing protein [Ignavibacteriaceae bacterium]
MKINLLIVSVFLSIIIYANIDEMNGIVGLTKLDGGVGCACHWIEPTDSVVVLIEGPDSVFTSDTAQFKISIFGGPAEVGGFNLAAYSGELSSLDSLTHLELNTATLREELTHSFPFPFLDGEAYWLFNYIAPDSTMSDTLYATGNSCNGDGIPTYLDQWNFGENFIVTVIDLPVIVEKENMAPKGFALYQNYPNPFNPTTKIKFTIPSNVKREMSNVTLKVYDVLGNEVATLVDEVKSGGEYEVEFNVTQDSSPTITSGVYFYQIKTENFVETKKMVLMK